MSSADNKGREERNVVYMYVREKKGKLEKEKELKSVCTGNQNKREVKELTMREQWPRHRSLHSLQTAGHRGPRQHEAH